MKEHDILDALGEVSEETVSKYALPKSKPLEAAGKEHITMSKSTEKTKKSIRINPIGIAAAVAVCIGLNAAVIYGVSRMKQDADGGLKPAAQISEEISEIKDFKMPDLIGMDYEDAVKFYGNAIRIEIISQEYSSYDENRIFDQDVMPGEMLSSGSIVNVKVSLGAQKIELPDMIGWDFETAKPTILQMGMYVDKRSSYSTEVPEGCVISTDPEPGTLLEPSSYVQVTVSLGVSPNTVPVPNFSGMAWENAAELAKGLKIELTRIDVESDLPEGTILEQDIEAGTEVREDSAIQLKVAAKQSTKQMPIWIEIPAGITYNVELTAKDSAGKVIGYQTFSPEELPGKTAISVYKPTEGDEEITVYAKNTAAGIEAPIAKYTIHSDSDTYETILDTAAQTFELLNQKNDE